MKNKNKFTNQTLTKEELEKINQLNNEFNKAKMAIADTELQKWNLIRVVEQIKAEFSIHEKALAENAVLKQQMDDLQAQMQQLMAAGAPIEDSKSKRKGKA